MTTPGPSDLRGRSALVIGANGGIGAAIAHELGAAGARLTIASRDRGRLEDLRSELVGAGYVCRAVPVDVTQDDQVAALVRIAAEDGLDVAVNNVGVAHPPAPLQHLDLDVVDQVLAVTLRGVLVSMKYQLGALQDGGSLVNVVSTAGLTGAPGMSAYVAAKHGVVGLTRTAALDHADRGVRVNAVAPGAIDSGPITALDETVRNRVGASAPLGRLGLAREVAAAVTWLASPLASFTTGAILSVDGGKGARGA
ncbi:SDR family NAD(P)-dependent oxidoreductase [Nakamurella sp. A5-74]|uniref:SDR family NAD(P)-dependent oxidoreductase n=1 Tax=Nakamurella sp. A5-74 TaxID=3158264 RepID=A0AAU8DNY2_9ACTN